MGYCWFISICHICDGWRLDNVRQCNNLFLLWSRRTFYFHSKEIISLYAFVALLLRPWVLFVFLPHFKFGQLNLEAFLKKKKKLRWETFSFLLWPDSSLQEWSRMLQISLFQNRGSLTSRQCLKPKCKGAQRKKRCLVSTGHELNGFQWLHRWCGILSSIVFQFPVHLVGCPWVADTVVWL